jgi:hypothetical protein
MVQVSFRHPEETDLVFFYIDKQMKTFDEEGMRRPDHKILIGEKEIIVELSMPDTDAPIGPTDG